MNEDPCATEKLADGIRRFAADTVKLEQFLAENCKLQPVLTIPSGKATCRLPRRYATRSRSSSSLSASTSPSGIIEKSCGSIAATSRLATVTTSAGVAMVTDCPSLRRMTPTKTRLSFVCRMVVR